MKLFYILATNIGDLSSLIEYMDFVPQFKKYRLKLFSSVQNKLGWDSKVGENPLVAMLRPMILALVGKSDNQAVIDEARRRFEQHLNGDLIDPNIRGVVYVLVSRYGDEKTQESLRKLYTAADMTEEKVRLLRSMGQSLKPEIIEDILEFIFNPVRSKKPIKKHT